MACEGFRNFTSKLISSAYSVSCEQRRHLCTPCTTQETRSCPGGLAEMGWLLEMALHPHNVLSRESSQEPHDVMKNANSEQLVVATSRTTVVHFFLAVERGRDVVHHPCCLESG